MDELAKQIAKHLGSDAACDIDAIEDWLLQVGDDGTPVDVLADRFNSAVGLPSHTMA